jgi:hypothetical protein
MSMTGEPPCSAVVSPQRPPTVDSVDALNGRLKVLLQLWSTTICGRIVCLYINRNTDIMHAILGGSESCACNKDESDRHNPLCLWNSLNNCFEITAPSHPQSGGVVSDCPKFVYPNSLLP